MPVYISLLRGINVGGHKKIKMADLRALYESLDFTGTKTILQSGNAIFESQQSDRVQLSKQIEAAIEEHFDFHTHIIIRTTAEMKDVIERNPFSAEQETDPKKLLVMFLSAVPDAAAIDNLRQAHSGSEKIQSSGQELYLYYPDGAGRSKLTTTLIEKKLAIVGTARNWNTVSKLVVLADEF
jgi:uncharacterized protein (DUF1697 family)